MFPFLDRSYAPYDSTFPLVPNLLHLETQVLESPASPCFRSFGSPGTNPKKSRPPMGLHPFFPQGGIFCLIPDRALAIIRGERAVNSAARVPSSHGGSRRFESSTAHHIENKRLLHIWESRFFMKTSNKLATKSTFRPLTFSEAMKEFQYGEPKSFRHLLCMN